MQVPIREEASRDEDLADRIWRDALERLGIKQLDDAPRDRSANRDNGALSRGIARTHSWPVTRATPRAITCALVWARTRAAARRVPTCNRPRPQCSRIG